MMFVPEAEAIHKIGASVRSDPVGAATIKRMSMARYYYKHKSLAANIVVQSALIFTGLLRKLTKSRFQ